MRKLTIGALAAVVSLSLAACGSSVAQPGSTPESSGETQKGFPVTVAHNAGETTVEAAPKSIVVYDMAALDTLDAIGAGDLVVGVPTSAVPTWLKDSEGIDYSALADVGTLKEPNIEAVAKLNPDLVVVGARSASFYEEFSKNFTTVDASVPWDEDGYSQRVAESVLMLGNATGNVEQATQISEEILSTVRAHTDAAKGSDLGTAMVLMTSGGEISMHGPKSRWAPIFDVFGFKPIAQGEAEEGHKGQKISFETVRDLNPDYIFVVDRDAAVGQTEAGATAEQVLDNALVNETNAAKEGKIIYLSPERWYIVMTGATNYLAELAEIDAAL